MALPPLRAGWRWLPLLLLLSARLPAAELSLTEAIGLALEGQPRLAALEQAAIAAREGAVAEAQLPDPRLRLGLNDVPVSGADAFSLDRDGMTMATVGLMQEMVRRDKREAAAARLRAEAGRFQAEGAATALAIRREVALAWADVFAAERRAELYGRLADELAAQRGIAGEQLSTGAGATELFQLEALRSMAQHQRLAAEGELRRARAELGRWIGEAANRPLPVRAPEARALLAADESGLDEHPQLKSSRQAEEVSRQALQEARAARRPDWSWEVMYGRRPQDGADLVSLQVYVALPWDRPQRQDRRVAQQHAELARAQAQTEDLRRQLAFEQAAAKADWQAVQAQEHEHRQGLLPAARARLEAAQAAYSAGLAPLASVWEARRAQVEAELAHWSIIAEQLRAAARLAYFQTEENRP